MKSKPHILAISGSTRKKSSNLNLIRAIAELSLDAFSISIFDGLAEIPHFNPDLDNENPPEQVAHFRQLLKDVDGILICTPEYAIGVPGTLKNALDWTVASMEFSQKPVALITASTSGHRAHQSLLGTLLIIEARITEQTHLVISSVKTKVNVRHEIIHNETLEKVQVLIQSFAAVIEGSPGQSFLPAPLLMGNE